METCDTTLTEIFLTINELKDAFFSLKTNKSAGYDDISFNVVRNCFGPLVKPLMFIFNLSLEKGCFPDQLKIARVTPVFKADSVTELGNYRPISVLPCFSKILERIMYNGLFKYLKTNNILYSKQFGFQEGHSTEHAIIQLIDQINNSFEKNHYTLGIFIDLSKAFDTVDYNILIKKLNKYGIKGNNLKWFESYLNNRKQYITYGTDKSTEFENMICGVPQGSILGPLLFLMYINDLPIASKVLDPIMFADDTNLFYSHYDIKILFNTVNEELKKLVIWFTSNKLSLNIKKTKYTFFHKNSVKDKIPLKLPDLHIFDKTIERTSSIKFLGVMLDENITWSNHINIIEKKIAKNIGLLYKARVLLNKESLKTIYFSYMHSYLNYANIAWASTYFTKLKTIHYQQKHAARIIFYEDILTHSRPLLRSLNALNVYQINLYQHANFMYKFKNNQTPKVFDDMFEKPSHKYPTRSSEVSYTYKKFSLNSSKYSIPIRVPKIWNELITKDEKEINSFSLFQKYVKAKLLESDNERKYF